MDQYLIEIATGRVDINKLLTPKEERHQGQINNFIDLLKEIIKRYINFALSVLVENLISHVLNNREV